MKIIIHLKQWLVSAKQKRRINPTDIALFLRQFATLIAAGIPLIQCCDILEKCQEKIRVRLLIYAIKREILSGKNLFFSLRKYPLYFDELTCQLIQIGEHTGKLDSLLSTIALYHEKRLAFKKQIKEALFYPCIITCMAIAITFCMFLFVIPRFAELFNDMQDHLPLFTIWLFYLATQLQQKIGWILLSLPFIFFILIRTSYLAKIKSSMQQLLTQLPIIKNYLHKIRLARFARNLAITFAAGIPIVEALKLTAQVAPQAEFSHRVLQLRHKINSGLPLHHAMETLTYFPPLMIHMTKIGEESGLLEPMLIKTAEFFEAEVNHLIERLGQLLEPLIMIVLGVLIGGLVIGMYLPIFKLGSTL